VALDQLDQVRLTPSSRTRDPLPECPVIRVVIARGRVAKSQPPEETRHADAVASHAVFTEQQFRRSEQISSSSFGWICSRRLRPRDVFCFFIPDRSLVTFAGHPQHAGQLPQPLLRQRFRHAKVSRHFDSQQKHISIPTRQGSGFV